MCTFWLCQTAVSHIPLSPHAQAGQTQVLFSSSFCWGAQSGLTFTSGLNHKSNVSQHCWNSCTKWWDVTENYKASLSSSTYGSTSTEWKMMRLAHLRAAFGTAPFLVITHQGRTLTIWNCLPLCRQTWMTAINRGDGEDDDIAQLSKIQIRICETWNKPDNFKHCYFWSTLIQSKKQLLSILCNIRKCINIYKSSVILLQGVGEGSKNQKNLTKLTPEFFSQFWGGRTRHGRIQHGGMDDMTETTKPKTDWI